jgi:acyl-CoA thioester hydrolase/1,4-dihydroxy-2-naphthoyl-CoA hydrolase
LFETKIRINFYDADPAGILFFANAFKLAHTAYEEFLEDILKRSNPFDDEKIVIPIVHAEADYHAVILPSEVITVKVKVRNLRESSFSLEYEFFGNNDKVKTKVRTIHVAVDKTNLKKTALPEELKEALGQHVEQ